jgi:general secretion pathway protein C
MTNRYFNIANLVLLTAGVFLCVQTFYAVVTPRPDYSAVPASPAVRPVSTSAASYSPPPPGDYKAITTRNIFNSGIEEIAPKAKSVDIDKLKQTKMKLKLWGTVTGQSGRAYAVIEDTKTRQQNLYHSGDTIQNAVVKLILREKVVLNVDDRDEILAMEEISGRRARPGAARKRARASSGTGNRKLPVSRYPRKIKLRSDQIQNAMENLGQLMEQATLRPHIEDGQTSGISITGIKPNAIFRKMRLRNGDVITAVNGNSIGSVEDAAKVFEELSSGSNIQLQIKRRGRQQTLDYSIE